LTPAGAVTPAVFAMDEKTSIDSGGANQFWYEQGFAIDYLIKFQVSGMYQGCQILLGKTYQYWEQYNK
jgi:hypothetical protein